MAQTLLFVYGTLKRGQRNHALLAGQEFLGPAVTLPLYRLYGLDWHPGLVLDRTAGLAVHGELWQVDEQTLRALDEYEGVPDWFVRDHIAIADHFREVQAYFFNRAVPGDAPSGDRWPLLV